MYKNILYFSTLWEHSDDICIALSGNIQMTFLIHEFFLVFQEIRDRHFICIVSLVDNLHVMSNLFFFLGKINYFHWRQYACPFFSGKKGHVPVKISPEIFTQHAKHLNVSNYHLPLTR